MGILLLPRKDRNGKVALLLGWSLEFRNPCLGPGFAEALPKSEQGLLREHVAQSKMVLLTLFYLWDTPLSRLERGLSIRQQDQRNLITFRQSICSNIESKLLSLKRTNALARLFQQTGNLQSEAELEPVREV